MSAGLKKTLIYAALIAWTVVALFPIYWTLTTTFKSAPDVMKGNMIPFLEYAPDWKGLRSLGLSPDTILNFSTPREEFLKRFYNSIIASLGASVLALIIGTMPFSPVCLSSNTAADPYPLGACAGGVPTVVAPRRQNSTTTLKPALS
jgi:ABC-type maltose transport system permease subunit